MLSMAQLSDKIRDYEFLKAQADEIEGQLKAFKAQADAAKDEVIAGMLDIAEDASCEVTVTVEGRKYSIGTKDYFSIEAGKKDEAFRQLRELGLGGLIVESVKKETLTNSLESIMDLHQGVLPDEYAELLGSCSKFAVTKLYSRKI
jgi:hypothetical protein